jgi:pilus assembly protein CpaB
MPQPPPRPPLRAPRLWRRFRRQPAVYWLAAVGLAGLTALTVARVVDQAREELDRYGPARPTLVATADLGAGASLGPDDVEVRLLPAALLPAGALGADAVVAGRVASVAILAGEPVTEARLAPAGLSAVAALLPRGTRGLAVPAGPGAPPLQVGDTVDVLATLDAGGRGPPTAPVAVGALVVHVTEEAVTVAVTVDEAPRVAYALSAGAVTLSLSATPTPPAG